MALSSRSTDVTRTIGRRRLATLRGEAYKYATKDSDESTSFFKNFWTEHPATPMDGRNNTLLHLLVASGSEGAVEGIIELVNNLEDLGKRNTRGETALHEAAKRGHERIVKMLLERARALTSNNNSLNEMDLIRVSNELGEIPLFLAAGLGNKRVFWLLVDTYQSDFMTKRQDGCTVIHAAIIGEHYRMAFDIVEKYPQLAHIPNNRGETALSLLVSAPSSFKSSFINTLTTFGIHSTVVLELLIAFVYYILPPLYRMKMKRAENDAEDSFGNRSVTSVSKLKRCFLIQKLVECPFLKDIEYAKQKHILAEALMKKLIEQEVDWSRYTYHEYIDYESKKSYAIKHNGGASNPLIQAIKMGIVEVVDEILKKFPDAENCFDENGRNIMQIAVEYKSMKLYELLKKQVIDKDGMLEDVDYEGNTILHLATKIKPITSYSLGSANLMAWDVYWFEHIKNDCSPRLVNFQNTNGETAQELFEKNAQTKREAAENSLKSVSGNLTVVSTLIGTVSFAALFTVPGGFQDKKGYPLLYEIDKPTVESFLFYSAATLFSSLFALGTLLSIQLSRFHLDDFYIALPLKLTLVIIALFQSSCFIICTCLQAFILEEYFPIIFYPFVIFCGILIVFVYMDAIYYIFAYLIEVLHRQYLVPGFKVIRNLCSFQ